MRWETAVGIALAPVVFLGIQYAAGRIARLIDRGIPDGRLKRLLLWRTSD
jgi:hypothetical protein